MKYSFYQLQYLNYILYYHLYNHFAILLYEYHHNSEQINFVNLWLDKQAIGFIFPIHYSEQINFVNLWLDKQAIGFIFPIHNKKCRTPYNYEVPHFFIFLIFSILLQSVLSLQYLKLKYSNHLLFQDIPLPFQYCHFFLLKEPYSKGFQPYFLYS